MKHFDFSNPVADCRFDNSYLLSSKTEYRNSVGICLYELYPFMNYELYKTDHLKWEIDFTFSIKTLKN